eukprot:CAMPEP_0178960270 /NCGR_PEP_ID=MMETSP0789-20121207/12867_1 /TAXON_ID=3005 /ORGANISM="Rhizosolenia setigera, Strain CCMP 1694" /LENGTH=787 /DNA_ID=CAMNT_0020643593 /DNA_START=82 /DNA_END=2445 /DNA_ORIENTATION=+
MTSLLPFEKDFNSCPRHEFLKENRFGYEFGVDPKFFPKRENRKRKNRSLSSILSASSTVDGTETVTVYENDDCSGRVVTFPLNNDQESRCTWCWDSCFERFDDDDTDAHTNVNSIQIPSGVVALAFGPCLGSFGYSDPGYIKVLEPGSCQTLDGAAHVTFAAETSTGSNEYYIIGDPVVENGYFESELSTAHWMYGPGGIDNAEGHVWYQYIFHLLDPEGPRVAFQVGTGGTWLGPTQSEWNLGDPCRCSPLDWPATGDGDSCNLDDLTQCTNGCCGTDGCGGLLQTMEGGAGYWLGKLPTPQVKWTIGAVSKCYRYWTNSPLEVANSDDLECSDFGVIIVSNSLLYPPDGIGFTNEGMFGHAWINTPLGKKSDDDTDRFVSLILDTDNFKGPVAYMLPEYYRETSQWSDLDGNKHPDASETFANSGMTTGGGAFEWSTTPVYGHQDGNNRNIRIPKMQFSFNNGEKETILMSGGISWENKNGIFTPLDEMLSGLMEYDESKLLNKNTGYVHPCSGTNFDLQLDFEGNTLETGGTVTHREESDGFCSAVVTWDGTSSLCNSTHCNLYESYKISDDSLVKEDGEFIYTQGGLEPYDDIPSTLEGAQTDIFPQHDFFLNYDRRTPENLCGAPHMTDDDNVSVFKRKTSTGDWIAWKWYRFVDQPGFQRLNLSTAEKDYLQDRITKLHQDMEENAPFNEWIKTPSSTADLVTIDPMLLVTPKYPYGYVPIVIYQGMEEPDVGVLDDDYPEFDDDNDESCCCSDTEEETSASSKQTISLFHHIKIRFHSHS